MTLSQDQGDAAAAGCRDSAGYQIDIIQRPHPDHPRRVEDVQLTLLLTSRWS